MLSMSGRMPGVWRRVVDQTLRVGSALENRLAIDVVDRSDLGFQMDEIGHLILWGTGMIVIGLATRHRFRADAVAVSLFAASLALEFAQGAFAPARSMAVGDIIANATGIMAGLSIVVVADIVLSLMGNRTHRPVKAG